MLHAKDREAWNVQSNAPLCANITYHVDHEWIVMVSGAHTISGGDWVDMYVPIMSQSHRVIKVFDVNNKIGVTHITIAVSVLCL